MYFTPMLCYRDCGDYFGLSVSMSRHFLDWASMDDAKGSELPHQRNSRSWRFAHSGTPSRVLTWCISSQCCIPFLTSTFFFTIQEQLTIDALVIQAHHHTARSSPPTCAFIFYLSLIQHDIYTLNSLPNQVAREKQDGHR
jgi:hypothetical protein